MADRGNENTSVNPSGNRPHQGRSTLIVMISTLASRLLGFVRVSVIAAYFGASGAADVLNAVFNIPNNLRKLMAEGALSSAFIPILSRNIIQDPSLVRARLLTRSIFTFQLLILIPMTVLAVVFAEPLMSILVPFPEKEKSELAVEIFRWFVNYLLLISLSAVFMAVLNAHRKFAIPATTPVFFSVAVIASLIVFQDSLGIYSMVPGVLIGGIGQILFQTPTFLRLGYSFLPLWNFLTTDLKETLRKWLPAITTSVVFILGQQISMTMAAGLTDGSASALTNAITFWQLPAGIFSASIITVLFPKMSRQVAARDWEGVSSTLTEGLRFQALLLIPSGFLMGLFSKELVALALQRGAFTEKDTLVTAQVLSFYCWGLFTAGAFNFLQRYFYALGHYKTPFYVSLFCAGIDIAFCLVFKDGFLGVNALAIGNSLNFSLGFLILLFLAYRTLPKAAILSLAWFALRAVLALTPLFAAYAGFQWLWGDWWHQGLTLSSLGLFLVEGGSLFLLYALVLRLFGIDILSFFRRRKGHSDDK